MSHRILSEDSIISFYGSTVQHGNHNNRVYLMSFGVEDSAESLIPRLLELQQEHSYTKIFCKVPDYAWPDFQLHGFEIEAFIPRFYLAWHGCFFVSRFFDNREIVSEDELPFLRTLGSMLASTGKVEIPPVFPGTVIRPFTEDESALIAAHLEKVFPEYPFPVSDSSYVKHTMKDGTVYFGAFIDEKLAGISSAETSEKSGAVEMTDFAVLPEFRGKKLAQQLLKYMEEWIRYNTEISMSFTIARLREPGMNAVFLKSGYTYAGTLKNNTRIFSGIESMNVYYKPLI